MILGRTGRSWEDSFIKIIQSEKNLACGLLVNVELAKALPRAGLFSSTIHYINPSYINDKPSSCIKIWNVLVSHRYCQAFVLYLRNLFSICPPDPQLDFPSTDAAIDLRRRPYWCSDVTAPLLGLPG